METLSENMNFISKQMRKYNGETELKENEYLLKIRNEPEWTTWSGAIVEASQTGFLTKLRKADKKLPKKFEEWGHRYNYESKSHEDVTPDTWIVEQNLQKGWKIDAYRRGTSADWTVVLHPEGYTLEIKTQNFMDLVSKVTITKGLVKEALRWVNGELKLK